jgi:hypothetical protein
MFVHPECLPGSTVKEHEQTARIKETQIIKTVFCPPSLKIQIQSPPNPSAKTNSPLPPKSLSLLFRSKKKT